MSIRGVLVVGGLVLAGVFVSPSPAQQNPIQRENALSGTPSWGQGSWQDSAVEGYLLELGVAAAPTVAEDGHP